MNNFMKMAYKGAKDICRHSATLCAIGAIAGLITSVVLASEAGSKAAEIDEDLTGKERLKECAKIYTPTIISTAVTGGLIMSSDRIHAKNELALGAAAAMWESRYKKLDTKIKETMPQEEYGPLQKDLMEDRMLEATKPQQLAPGTILVYLDCIDQYVVTSREKLAWGLIALNSRLSSRSEVTLNFFIQVIEINSDTRTAKGEKYGWYCSNPDQFNQDWEYNNWPTINLHSEFLKCQDENGAYIIYFEPEPMLMYYTEDFSSHYGMY